jgi:hypothetical protein
MPTKVFDGAPFQVGYAIGVHELHGLNLHALIMFATLLTHKWVRCDHPVDLLLDRVHGAL